MTIVYLVSICAGGCESTVDFLARVIFKSHRMEVGMHAVLRLLELEIMDCGAVCVCTSQHCKFIVQVTCHRGYDAIMVMYRYQCFRGDRCLHLHGSPIMLDGCCHQHCCENLTSHRM
jgi:hypothetical protein